MSLTVLAAGFHTRLVDAGRPRSRHLGLPLGGAADRAAHALANGLVGNGRDAPALELTLVGPTLQADRRTACAVFGAPFAIAIAGKGRVPVGATFVLESGDAVKIGGTPSGARGYLAVAGGFEGPTILASRSGLDPVRDGEVLACAASSVRGRSLAFAALPIAANAPLRVIPGPQFDWFLDPATFVNGTYEIAPASDRMGLRLTGPRLERRPRELVSEAVAPGAIQIANDGLPVILGIDGQTIGGYPKIAHVIRADLDRLAQLRAGDAVTFARLTPAQAAEASAAHAALVREWVTRLRVTFEPRDVGRY